MQETWVRSLGWEDPQVGNIPWRRKWQPTPVFLPRISHGQRNLVGYSPWGRKESDTSTHTQSRRRKKCWFNPWDRKIPWSRKWQPTPVFLPVKFHGQKSLEGRGAWQGTVHGTAKNWTQLSNWAHRDIRGFWEEKCHDVTEALKLSSPNLTWFSNRK